LWLPLIKKVPAVESSIQYPVSAVVFVANEAAAKNTLQPEDGTKFVAYFREQRRFGPDSMDLAYAKLRPDQVA